MRETTFLCDSNEFLPLPRGEGRGEGIYILLSTHLTLSLSCKERESCAVHCALA